MYYLLGYRLFGRESKFTYEERRGQMSWVQTVLNQKSHFGKSQIFDEMEEMLLIQVKA